MNQKLILLYVILYSITTNAQWTNYTKSNSGLVDNSIRTIIIDKKGNKWFGYGASGKKSGVSKFDGKTWTNYTSQNSGLCNDTVYSMAVDLNGVKWFCTDVGVSSFNDTVWTTYRMTDGLVSNEVKYVAFDSENNKWFGCRSGASKFDGKIWTNYTNNGLSDGVIAVAIDSKGNKWFTVEYGGVVEFDGTNWINIRYAQIFTSVAIDSKDNIWFGSYGACKFSNNLWTDYTTTNSNLADNSVSALAFDKQGTKWIGTFSGVSKFNDTIWTNYNPSNSSLPAYSPVRSIAIDSQGTKWIGTENGLTVFNNSFLNTADTKAESLQIYLNFANNTLFIKDLIDNAKISIYDLSAELLVSKQINCNQIDISNLRSGVYIIKIETSKEIVTRKFIKQ
ncbi:MAG: T9SS type A sorting domain-containing protein [Paludibacter sp.]